MNKNRKEVTTSNPSSKRRLALTGFLSILLIATGVSAPATAAKVGNQTLRYQVDVRGNDAGELEVVIESTDDGYIVRSISHLSLLATMFAENTTVESAYQLIGDSLLLMSGKEILNESGEVRRSFTVDHNAGLISFSEGDPFPFNSGTVIDADAFPMLLVHAGADAIAGKKTISVSPKRGRGYQYSTTEVELVEVPAGEFQGIKLQGVRLDNPERAVNVWLRPEGDHVPLKIVTGEPGKLTTVTLLE